ncbi:MAG: ribosomal protein S18-alanine N-acetyltransferase [Bordetella sp.]|nr:MAG: ribosomal protein S18-alanine N-acetyltransferase [Bordetella sp.]
MDKKNLNDAISAGYDSWILRDKRNLLIGFSIVMHTPDLSHLLLIAIKKDFQRKGFGSLLLNWCEKKSREKSSGISLEVRSSNDIAISFYKKSNYKCIGIRKNYYRDKNLCEDAFIMEKLFHKCEQNGK